jgi:hypothetical protein
MDIDGMIAELRAERACLDEALIGLEKLAQKRTPRRGRPRKWLRPADIAEPRTQNGSANGSRHVPSTSSAN